MQPAVIRRYVMTGVVIFVIVMVVVAFAALIGTFVYLNHQYKKTDYYKRKKRSYFSLLFDKGAMGEFRLVRRLEKIEGYKKILYNVYLPKTGEKTTEIDILFMNNAGLFVLESKNRGGRFYGSQNAKNWTQYIGKQKYTVYNPIKQNEGHIRWLKSFLNDDSVPCYSYIVFGKTSESDLRKVTYDRNKCRVMYTNDLVKNLMNDSAQYGFRIMNEQIDEIFEKLYPLSEASQEVKDRHVEDIRSYTDK